MIRRKGFKKFHQRLRGFKPTYPLPEDIRSDLFLSNVIEPYKLSWVINAFTWSSSPQGVTFWNDTWKGLNTIEEQELACEILRDWKEQLHG